MQFFRSRTATRPLWRSLITCCLATVLSPVLLQTARAGFIGDYAVGNFTLSNTNGDGSAMTPDGGSTLIITGPNTGSGLAGFTDFTAFAAASGLVQFHYLFSSLDGPGWDYAGYLLGANFIQLADTDGQSSTVQFFVSAGQPFGFRVGSLDNTGEPGVMTIDSLSAPGGVPEPASLFVCAAGLGTVAVAVRRRRSAAKGGIQA